MVPLGNKYLIPSSYDYYTNNLLFGLYFMTYEETRIIIDKFFTFFRNEAQFKCYILYMESSLAIPYDKYKIKELISKMADFDHFKKYLDKLILRQEALVITIINSNSIIFSIL